MLRRVRESPTAQAIAGTLAQLDPTFPSSYVSAVFATKEKLAQRNRLLQELTAARAFSKAVTSDLLREPHLSICTRSALSDAVDLLNSRLEEYETTPEYLGLYPQYFRKELRITREVVSDAVDAFNAEINMRLLQYQHGRFLDDVQHKRDAFRGVCPRERRAPRGRRR